MARLRGSLAELAHRGAGRPRFWVGDRVVVVRDYGDGVGPAIGMTGTVTRDEGESSGDIFVRWDTPTVHDDESGLMSGPWFAARFGRLPEAP